MDRNVSPCGREGSQAGAEEKGEQASTWHSLADCGAREGMADKAEDWPSRRRLPRSRPTGRKSKRSRRQLQACERDPTRSKPSCRSKSRKPGLPADARNLLRGRTRLATSSSIADTATHPAIAKKLDELPGTQQKDNLDSTLAGAQGTSPGNHSELARKADDLKTQTDNLAVPANPRKRRQGRRASRAGPRQNDSAASDLRAETKEPQMSRARRANLQAQRAVPSKAEQANSQGAGFEEESRRRQQQAQPRTRRTSAERNAQKQKQSDGRKPSSRRQAKRQPEPSSGPSRRGSRLRRSTAPRQCKQQRRVGKKSHRRSQTARATARP